MTSNNKDNSLPSVPGDARIDPEVPVSAKEAPLTGVEAAKETPFKDAVAGHAKYFAGKVFGNDKEVQQGAARLRGEEDTLPAGGKIQHSVSSGSAAAATAPSSTNTNTAPPVAGGTPSSSAAAATTAGGAQQPTTTTSAHSQSHAHTHAHPHAAHAHNEPHSHSHTAGEIPVGATPVSSSTGAGTGSGVGSARGTAPPQGATSGAGRSDADTAAFH